MPDTKSGLHWTPIVCDEYGKPLAIRLITREESAPMWQIVQAALDAEEYRFGHA